MTDGDIHDFVDRYRAAFDALDPDSITELYDDAAVIVNETDTVVFPLRAAIRANMVALTDHYRHNGYRRANVDRIEVEHVSRSLSSVDVAWTLVLANEHTSFSARYWLAERGKGPIVTAVLAYGESTG